METPTTKDLAMLVLSDEMGDGSDLSDLQSAAQRTFEKLNVHLSKRLGSRGYHALLKRAVTLAVTDFPWLAPVRVSEDGTVEGFQNMIQSQPASEGCVAILARLIELLDTFIGRKLTMRVLRNAWPDAVKIDTAGRQGESNG